MAARRRGSNRRAAAAYCLPLTACPSHRAVADWYNDYFLTPEMSTVYVAIDEQTATNGPLKLLKGSHRMGRVDHWSKDEQQGADLERVEMARARFEEVELRLKPGDAVFFDGEMGFALTAPDGQPSQVLLIHQGDRLLEA